MLPIRINRERPDRTILALMLIAVGVMQANEKLEQIKRVAETLAGATDRITT